MDRLKIQQSKRETGRSADTRSSSVTATALIFSVLATTSPNQDVGLGDGLGAASHKS